MSGKGRLNTLCVELRIFAQWQVLMNCPEYFILFDPISRKLASDNEVIEAKKNLIKARYPKFYEEVFGDDEEG